MICASECDCGAPVGHQHDPDCNSFRNCDEGRSCDLHAAQSEADHSYMRGMSHGAVFGFLDDSEKQSLREAGRGHLVFEL